MRLSSPRSSLIRAQRGGFTIIELLVACAITALIAGLMLGLVGNVLGSWNRSQGILMTEIQANRALDQLALDLQGALYRDDGKTWLAASVQADSSVSDAWVAGRKPVAPSLDPAAASLVNARFGVAGVWLRFFTTRQGADARTSDPPAPIAVGYQIIRRAPAPEGQQYHYLFYRGEATPSATFAAGYDLRAASYTVGSSIDGAPGTVVSPDISRVLAENVIDFGVRLYVFAPNSTTGGPELTCIFPLNATDSEYRAASLSTSGNLSGRFPAVADVMLRVLTEEGVRQIAALEDSRITGDWWTIANANSKVFTRRILLNGSPL